MYRVYELRSCFIDHGLSGTLASLLHPGPVPTFELPLGMGFGVYGYR